MSGTDESVSVYLGLGANVGDRLSALRDAVRGLNDHPAIEVTGASSVYASEAHVLPGQEPQPEFLNAVVAVRTRLRPDALLAVTQRLEREAGRKQTARWHPRPLDIDVLVFGDRSVHGRRLAIPHPHLAERRFVLEPLSDLAPNLFVPAPFNATVSELLRRCADGAALSRTPHDIAEFLDRK